MTWLYWAMVFAAGFYFGYRSRLPEIRWQTREIEVERERIVYVPVGGRFAERMR